MCRKGEYIQKKTTGCAGCDPPFAAVEKYTGETKRIKSPCVIWRPRCINTQPGFICAKFT